MEDEHGQQEDLETPGEGQDSNLDESDEGNEELTKAQELARNQKIRAEKAEAELKKLKAQSAKPETETPKKEDLSLKDIMALRDVHEEDVDYLLEQSKKMGQSVAELKKDPYMKVVLKAREEERATAEATNASPTKKGMRKDSDAVILANFEKGIVSDKDEDIERLARAHHERKKAMAKGN